MPYTSRKRLRDVMSRKLVKRLRASKREIQARMTNARVVANLNRRTGGYIGRFQPSLPRGELKFKDIGFNQNMTANTTVSAQDFITVGQGNGPSERIGQSYTIKSIQFRGNLVWNAGPSTGTAQVYYMWMVLDTECNGVDPNTTDIFTSNDPKMAMINLANSKRFRILKKWTKVFQPQLGVIGTNVGPMNHPVEFYLKCNIPIKYNAADTTGAKAARTRNNIVMVVGAVTDLGATENITGVFRIRYTD